VEGLRKSFYSRATHNAWVFQKEVEAAIEKKTRGTYEDYVQALLGSGWFSRFLLKMKEPS
jgi:hypothetical protein